MRALLILALLAATGCIRREPPSAYCGEPPEVKGSAIAWQRTMESTVEGIVTDVLGEPLGGAMVHLAGTSLGAVTEKDGRFRIGRVSAREYQIVVRAIPYVRAERSISLGAGEGAKVLAILERAPSGMISDCFLTARPR